MIRYMLVIKQAAKLYILHDQLLTIEKIFV